MIKLKKWIKKPVWPTRNNFWLVKNRTALLTLVCLVSLTLLNVVTLHYLQSTPKSSSFVENGANVIHLQNSIVALVRKNSDGQVLRSHCTGFFIAPKKIATALHCVELPNSKTELVLPGIYLQITPNSNAEGVLGRKILFVDFQTHNNFTDAYSLADKLGEAQVISIDSTNDLAILELGSDQKSSNDWLEIANGSRVGEKVFSLGMPRSQPWVLTQGIISASYYYEGGVLRIFHQAPIAPGSSGSPLVNNRGEVVGVTIQYMQELRYLGISAGYSNLRDLIKSGHQKAEFLNVLSTDNIFTSPEDCDPNFSSCLE